MAVVFYTPDGRGHCLLSYKDHVDTLRDYAGEDFTCWVEQLQDGFNREQAEFESDYSSYESSLDSNSACFQDLLDKCNLILQQLDKARINKMEVRRMITQMVTEIENQI